MADQPQNDEIAAAIRELAAKVDLLGNALDSAAKTIARAIRPPAGSGGSQVTEQGTFS